MYVVLVLATLVLARRSKNGNGNGNGGQWSPRVFVFMVSLLLSFPNESYKSLIESVRE